MIFFVTTRAHAYTVQAIVEQHGAQRCGHLSYEDILQKRSGPLGTWVFTDHERLPAAALHQLAAIAKTLRSHGARILNDPALVRSRYEILNRLHEAGINNFTAYRADSSPTPGRFPVFIRNAFDHNAWGLRLISSQAALDRELGRLEAEGQPLIGKLVIEYCGEEFLPGTWRRYSSYCVGGIISAHHVGFDRQWIVKDGLSLEKLDAHPSRDVLLEIESDFVDNNRFREVLEQVFSIARIDYGRVDFALYDGRIQVFEINTNPHHGNRHEVLNGCHPARRDSLSRAETALDQAIAALHRQGETRQIKDSATLQQ